MEASPTSSLNASRILRASRGVALGVALPILLAWAITHALHRRPQAVAVAAKEPPPALSGYGQLRLRLKLPGTNAGIAEPLISCGVAGDASLVFIKLLPKSRAKVGVESGAILVRAAGLGRLAQKLVALGDERLALALEDCDRVHLCLLTLLAPETQNAQPALTFL